MLRDRRSLFLHDDKRRNFFRSAGFGAKLGNGPSNIILCIFCRWIRGCNRRPRDIFIFTFGRNYTFRRSYLFKRNRSTGSGNDDDFFESKSDFGHFCSYKENCARAPGSDVFAGHSHFLNRNARHEFNSGRARREYEYYFGCRIVRNSNRGGHLRRSAREDKTAKK